MERSLRIIVFSKAPLPGLAKTRLIPVLGEQGAAALARRMLLHTLANAIASNLGSVELCVSPVGHQVWSGLEIPQSVALTDQGEGDLGERMARACSRSIVGGESVLLMGTDCPSCDTAYLQAMALALKDRDAVIAAAADGGYPAIGLRSFDGSIFRDIAWSTNSVLSETLEKFKALDWRYSVFPTLHDIDEPQDLQHLPEGWLSEEWRLLPRLYPLNKSI
jgi:uncharacterized protein